VDSQKTGEKQDRADPGAVFLPVILCTLTKGQGNEFAGFYKLLNGGLTIVCGNGYNELSFLEDAELCRYSREGNVLAEETLVHRYTKLVRALARPYFLYGGDFEDRLQEGLMGLLSAIRDYDPESGVPFRKYAEVCVRNRLYSAIRAANREKNAPLNYAEPLLDGTDEPVGPEEETPEERLLHRERYQELTEAIRALLSPLENQVLELYLQGLSYDEIGQQTGKGAKASDNAVQRIRKKVARYLSTGDHG